MDSDKGQDETIDDDLFIYKINLAFGKAQLLASKAGHTQFTPLHLAAALIYDDNSIFSQAIASVGGKGASNLAQRVFHRALKNLPSQTPHSDQVPPTTISTTLIELIRRTQTEQKVHGRMHLAADQLILGLIKLIRRTQAAQKVCVDMHLAIDQLILGLLKDSQTGDLLKEAGVNTGKLKLKKVKKLREKKDKHSLLLHTAIDLIDKLCVDVIVRYDSHPKTSYKRDRQLMILQVERREQLAVELHRLEQEMDKAKEAQFTKDWKEGDDSINKLQHEIVKCKKDKERVDEILQRKKKRDELLLALQEAERKRDLATAAQLRYGTILEMEFSITQFEREYFKFLKETLGPEHIEIVGREHIAKAHDTRREWYVGLAERLHKRVVGQDQAVSAVKRPISKLISGLCRPGEPIGSFLFLGPRGVGKTELTKALTEQLYDDENFLVRINIPDYSTQHSLSCLIVAPPEYVGCGKSGHLTQALMGAAHTSVLNNIVQLLDVGTLIDSEGHTVDLTNVIIILTSNLGAKHLVSGLNGECSMQVARDRVMVEAMMHFNPKLLSLLDDIVIFDPLSREPLKEVARLQTKDIAGRLGISLVVTDAALDYALAAERYDPVYGAWPIRKWLEKKVGKELSEMLCKKEIDQYSTVYMDAGPNGLVFRRRNDTGQEQ